MTQIRARVEEIQRHAKRGAPVEPRGLVLRAGFTTEQYDAALMYGMSCSVRERLYVALEDQFLTHMSDPPTVWQRLGRDEFGGSDA